ncbi:MAG: hypothetical protein QF903_10200 [Planctomycetota bacterium]|jgi:hypothetical protein|nr:hypothetical protein [Planctomycetota bacterium]MDP6763178.1 hypothetical protein [Planctomycetota bacterium]MDP6989838.1 hypothetical protein [Planctomycetota bacterium]
MTRALNLLALLVLGGLVGVVGWWTHHYRGSVLERERDIAVRDQRIAGLTADIEEQADRLRLARADLDRASERNRELTRQKRQLELKNRLLRLDHRLARIEVLEQLERDEGAVSRVRFEELGADGEPAGTPLTFEIQGRFLYLESQVVKFADDFVEAGDALRGRSICLFRRAWGERQRPVEGVELDTVGLRPGLAAGDEIAPGPHAELWQRFWDYANDRALAEGAGLRAAHGEAPFTQLRSGGRYRVDLRSSGGLSIRPE